MTAVLQRLDSDGSHAALGLVDPGASGPAAVDPPRTLMLVNDAEVAVTFEVAQRVTADQVVVEQSTDGLEALVEGKVAGRRPAHRSSGPSLSPSRRLRTAYPMSALGYDLRSAGLPS